MRGDPRQRQVSCPDPAQRSALAAVLAHAFGFPIEDAAGWFATAGDDNLRVLLSNDEVLAGLMHVPMGTWVGGRSVPTVGIAGVGVRLDARRQGVASDLMTETVLELHRRGVALSSLYASTYALYQAVGFDAAASCHLATVDPRLLPAHGREGQVELLSAANRPEIEAAHRDFYRSGLGEDLHHERGPYLWERTLGVRRGQRALGLCVRDDSGRICGWLSYRPEPAGGRHRVVVQDLFATAPWAAQRVWSAVADMAAMATEIVFATAPTDGMLLALPQPRFEVRLFDLLLLRICDVAAALQARGYRDAPNGAVCFHLHDAQVAANAGAWTLEVEAGVGTLRRGGTPELDLDVRTLASLYAGFASATALQQGGRQLSGDRAAIDRLAGLLRTRSAWTRDMY